MFPELLRTCITGVVDLSAVQIAQLEAHWELMLRWNRSLNLTAIDRVEEAVERHYAESLFLGRHVPEARIVDIGSGPGFPGIPVAILRPGAAVTLVESHQRKAVFLREATRRLGNVNVLAKRAEVIAGEFDWAVSRAVSYADLEESLNRLAPRAALLTGADSPPPALQFVWDEPIPLPWGKNRFLRLGHR